VYGGAPIGKQIEELARGAQVVAATPGRVLDHIERRTINLSKLAVFVLDECDEMLSMGFLPQINAIWERLPKGQQTLLFSATVPKDVVRIAQTRLSEPEFITLSGDHIGALEIQHFVYLSHGDKLLDLLRILETENPESAIVFCNTRDETKRVAKELRQMGYAADWLNADLNQAEREQVMARTRAGQVRFMVCTDVAARGIDISHLSHVINFDFPDSAEQYVHRTGRTGRAGNMGTAISLVAPDSIGDLYYLKLKFKIQPIERQLPSERELLTRKESDLVRLLELRFPKLPASDEYRSLARRLASHEEGESIIAGLLRAELGADAAAEAASQRRQHMPEPVPDPKKERERPRGEGRPKAPRAPEPARREVSGRRRRRAAPAGFEHEHDGIRYSTSDAPAAPDVAGSDEGSAPAGDANAKPPESSEPAEKSPFVNLFVSVGRRDGATADLLKSALADAGVSDGTTGRIAIRERHSYVEVPPELGERVITHLHGSELCGREAVVEVARPRGGASSPS
jgi:ATP-dependent RNA helicase DeaD